MEQDLTVLTMEITASEAVREDLAEGPVAIKGRLGHSYKHCFSVDQSCTFAFWIWLKRLEVPAVPTRGLVHTPACP
jgi:hypothetical protein